MIDLDTHTRAHTHTHPRTPAHDTDDITDPRNTWNGPIVTGPDGVYHFYVPLYKEGSLGGPPTMLHGIAKNVVGPWDWTSQPNMSTGGGENPAALVFPNKTTGKTVYSIWIGGRVHVADSPYGPFEDYGYRYEGGNPAPVYHKGAFYATNQGTEEVRSPWRHRRAHVCMCVCA